MIPAETESVTVPGMYRMSAAAYHKGPCAAPELSSTIARILCKETPLHAWTAHSKLGGAPKVSDDESEAEVEKSTNIQDFGSATHKIALGYGRLIQVINPLDHKGSRGGIPKGWTNDSIRAARYEAQALGFIPILPKYHARAERCARALRESAEAYLGCPVEDCLREVVICWQQEGIWCKAMLDIVRPDLLAWADFKSTGICVAAEAAARHFYSEDYEIQTSFYDAALDAIDPANMGRRRRAYLFAEQHPPHDCSAPIEPTEAGLQIGRFQVQRAMQMWRDCLEANEWPGYSKEPYQAQPPPWKLAILGNQGEY